MTDARGRRQILTGDQYDALLADVQKARKGVTAAAIAAALGVARRTVESAFYGYPQPGLLIKIAGLVNVPAPALPDRTRCKRGHRYTRFTPAGYGECRICQADAALRRRMAVTS